MTANELRIGNLFYMISRGGGIAIPMEEVPFKAVELHAFDIKCVAYNINPAIVEQWASIKYFDCSPIPLTEEWLLKFGFEKDNETYSWSKIVEDESKQLCVEIDCYPNREGFWYLSELKYVHQLQNLYFALTGNELTLDNN